MPWQSTTKGTLEEHFYILAALLAFLGWYIWENALIKAKFTLQLAAATNLAMAVTNITVIIATTSTLSYGGC